MRLVVKGLPLLALAIAGCTAGAQDGESEGGPRDQRTFQLGAFENVSVAGPHDVIVTVGGAPSVRADGNREVLDRLDIRVENGTLLIGNRQSNGSIFRRERGSATVHVSIAALAAASVAGSGDLRIDRVQGARFNASIGGSGDINIGELRVGEAQVAIAGSGNIHARGTAERQRISIAGSGDADLANLEGRSLAISVVGSGNVHGRATESAEISLMGSGDVEVAGPARCTVNRMGSGDVRCNI